MAYGIKYQFSIESVNGDEVDIYLLQRNYSGQRHIRSLGRAPVLKRERNDCILGTSLEIFAECRVDGEFAELYTSDAYEYKVEVYKRQTLQWTGFVSPELYAEPDIAPPYDVQIIATDGLGELKNYDFEASARKSIMTHIRSLLQHTGLSLSYKVISDLQFDDDGGRVDAEEAFIGAVVDIDNLVGESSYDVLQKLLRSIGACITQQEGRWYLIRESDLYYRLEDINAAEFGSMNSCDWWPVGNLNTDIMPAKNKIVITQENSYKDNILPAVAEGINGGWSLLGGVYYDRDEACNILPNEQSSMAYTLISADYPLRQPLMLTIKARCLTDIDGVTNSRIGIKVAAKGGVSSINASEFYLIYGKPAGYERYIPIWTAQSSGLGSSIVHSWEPPAVQFGDPDIEEIDIQIPLSDAGNGYYAYAYAEELEITVFNPSSDYPICVYECSLTQYHRPSGLELTANIGNNAREVYGDTEVMLASGDASLAVTMYGILVADGGITKWYSGNNSAESLLQLLALDIARQVALPRMRYRGKLNVPSMAVPEVPLLFFRDGTYYFLNTYSYDLLNDEVEVELISIPNAAVIIESESITELSPTTGGGSGNSGVAGGGDNDPGIIVDSEMSDESTNPVGNRVIKAYVDSETKKAQAAAEQYIQEEVLTDYATTKYVNDREEYLVGYTEKWVTDLEKDIKANPQNYIGLKTINNQSLFGSGNLEVKTTVDANDIRNAVFTGTGSQFLKGDGSLDSNAYLPLSGGTIESAGIPLTIKRTNNPYSVISFYGIVDGTSQHFGYLGFSGVGEPIYMTSGGSERILIHSGNAGDYALPLTGGMMGGHIVMGKNAIVFNPYQSETWANPQNSGLRILNTVGASATEALSPYAVGLSVSGYYGFQLASDAGIGSFYYRNTVTGVNGAWKQIAFTDSNITGKAGDSDKLGGHEASYYIGQHRDTSQQQDANSITANHITHSSKWLNATESSIMSLFDLTYSTDWKSQLLFSPYRQRLYSRFYYNGSTWSDWKQIAFTDSNVAGAYKLVHTNGASIIYNSGTTFYVGDTIYPNVPTHILGKEIALRYGASATAGLILNSSGNITIGSTDKLGTNADTKLYIDGGSIIGGKLEITPLNKVYLTFNVDSSLGTIAAFHDGVTRLPIAINPNGGNVLIGTTKDIGYKLDVNGSTHLDAYDGVSYVHIGPVAFGTKIQARGDGNTYFQSQRFDDTTVYYNLVLQELGGNVGIGTTAPQYKLDVAGTGRFTGLASFDAGVKIGSTTLAYTNLGLSINTSLYPSVSDSLSLGHSSQRWFSIYARKAYTEEVKIGEATLSWDTASQALKVDKPFYSTSQVSSGAKAVEAKAVIAPLALLKYPTTSTTTEYTDEQIASQYGLTTEVLDSLARGIYTRVTITYIGTPHVWDYEVYFPYGGNKKLVLRNNLETSFRFERNSTTGKWKITNA